ncbi:MAG: hypothetical protein FJX65_18830 [Alphaproteobacteria bacterium]|nr:hypothetical protein [Alphaproteobacteria bacterium]
MARGFLDEQRRVALEWHRDMIERVVADARRNFPDDRTAYDIATATYAEGIGRRLAAHCGDPHLRRAVERLARWTARRDTNRRRLGDPLH